MMMLSAVPTRWVYISGGDYSCESELNAAVEHRSGKHDIVSSGTFPSHSKIGLPVFNDRRYWLIRLSKRTRTSHPTLKSDSVEITK